jgi:hypothetical protein
MTAGMTYLPDMGYLVKNSPSYSSRHGVNLRF